MFIPCKRFGRKKTARHRVNGFTLIELSIVLVIVGLLVAGVLVGRDLIMSASVRSQIAQVTSIQSAVNVFRGKYDSLPGDIGADKAAKFSLSTRTGAPGDGDDNGLIEGWNTANNNGAEISKGESQWFWIDLTSANGQNNNFIEGSFKYVCCGSGLDSVDLQKYVPVAKIGRGNFLYIYSPGTCCTWVNTNPVNMIGLSVVTSVTGGGWPTSQPGLTVNEAKAIDAKLDDGLPQGGNVRANYNYGCCSAPFWAAGNGGFGASNTAATPGSADTCYDNSNVASAVQQYSVGQNQGLGVNCALSFRLK